MSKIGYIRVSTEHQETARQQEIMDSYQVDRIFSEKISGANKDRPQLRAMLDYVREGDTLYIESISRLGRSTKDLLNIIDTLTDKGVTLVSHKENIDTDTPAGKFIESRLKSTGRSSDSSMGNGKPKTSQAGTLCGEWDCRLTLSIAVSGSMRSPTTSPSRHLHKHIAPNMLAYAMFT